MALQANPTSGLAPLRVRFSSAGSFDPDGRRLRYAWDLNGDGEIDSRDPDAVYTYTRNGSFHATLTVTDRTRLSSAASVLIVVGNTQPIVELVTSPGPGDPFGFGDTVTFQVNVMDDTPVDCAQVVVSYRLRHDNHEHPQNSTAGCTGVIKTPPIDSAHAVAGDVRAVFVASYTDTPQDPNVPALTGTDQVVLQPNP